MTLLDTLVELLKPLSSQLHHSQPLLLISLGFVALLFILCCCICSFYMVLCPVPFRIVYFLIRTHHPMNQFFYF